MGVANCARSSAAASAAGDWHLPALRPGARALVLLSSACAFCPVQTAAVACADWPVPRDLSPASVERHDRVCDHLERPRRKRGQCRSELRATIGGGMPTPLASEHHGDDHLEPLQADAAVSMAAAVTVLRVRALG